VSLQSVVLSASVHIPSLGAKSFSKTPRHRSILETPPLQLTMYYSAGKFELVATALLVLGSTTSF
jgi:hypothetical protein